jgi:hypothetical protein
MHILKVLNTKFKTLIKVIKIKYKTKRKNVKFSKLSKTVRALTPVYPKGPRILFGPSFSIYEPCKVHDFILSQSLILRGATIVPCAIGRLQFGETSYLGGIWGGVNENELNISSVQSENNYQFVADSDRQLWQTWARLNPILLDKYLSKEKTEQLQILAETYKKNNYKTWTYKGLPVGKWAVDTLRNNSMVSDETIIKDYENKLSKYLYHILIMVEACIGVLDDIMPEIVISNDSYYYPWAILEKLCKEKSIPFYNCYPNIRKNSVCYAKGEPTMSLNVSRIWENFKKRDLTTLEKEVLEDFFITRTDGKYSPGLNTCDPMQNSNEIEKFNWNEIDVNKPTALMTPNLCWDLVALNKDVQFDSMFDWIDKTIEFFENHSEFQLIIKPHPAEENKHIPITQQTVVRYLTKRGKKIPENVIVLGAKTEVTVYDLFPIIKLGLVYTTTVGIEMATLGIPVITAGRSHYHSHGFTYDPPKEASYIETMNMLLENKEILPQMDTWAELAKKFMYLYIFIYPIDLGVYEYDFLDADIKINDGIELLPGKHEGLDFICNKILNMENIF